MSSPTPPEPRADVPSWEEVARDYGRFLYTVAYRLTMDTDDAQDLVQDVLLRVQRGLATYQPGSMEAWLSRITTNAFLDRVRRQKRRPQDALPDEDPDRVLPPSASAADAFDAGALPEHLQQALRDLPEDYRAAVVLCDVLDFSYEEIAEALDVPVGTVRSRIHRGRARLRQAVEASS
jgi:RNA polymerase sigma-70 factor (ECF subfamily)